MGHVVCIKGISSHFKRWPGFSPPGTPVTHPLVHTPFKEPGTAAPLQPLSTVCVCACVWEIQPNRLILSACYLVTVNCVLIHINTKSSASTATFFFFFLTALYICRIFNTRRRWINRLPEWNSFRCVKVFLWICFHGHSLWPGCRISEKWDLICQWSY